MIQHWLPKKSIQSILYYNGENSHLFINAIEVIKFKARGSEIVATLLYLENVSKIFSVDNMKNTGLN